MTTGERILALLPATSRTLLEKVGITSTSTLHKWLSRLRSAGEIRIGRWVRTVGDFAAVYVRGSGEDARRPPRWTRAQLQARYIKSLKASGVYEDYLADMRKYGAKYRRRKGQGRLLVPADPLMILLYKKI